MGIEEYNRRWVMSLWGYPKICIPPSHPYTWVFLKKKICRQFIIKIIKCDVRTTFRHFVKFKFESLREAKSTRLSVKKLFRQLGPKTKLWIWAQIANYDKYIIDVSWDPKISLQVWEFENIAEDLKNLDRVLRRIALGAYLIHAQIWIQTLLAMRDQWPITLLLLIP